MPGSYTVPAVNTAPFYYPAVAINVMQASLANPNATDAKRWTALHWASYRGDIEIATQLLAHNADVHATTTLSKSTPLHLAALEGHLATVQKLLASGASPFARSFPEAGPPRFQLGIDFDEAEAAEGMGVGALQIELFQGCRPVDLAALKENLDVMRVLLAAMAAAGEKAYSREGRWDVLHHALRSLDRDLIELLLDEGVDIEFVGPTGMRPLHSAVALHEIALIHLLIARGANVQALTADGRSVADIAEEFHPGDDSLSFLVSTNCSMES